MTENPAKKTSNVTYDEFANDSVQLLCNAVITGGFKELKSVFKYTIIPWHANIINEGGFKPTHLT